MSLGGKRRIHSKHFSAPHMPEDCVDLMQQVTPFVSYEECVMSWKPPKMRIKVEVELNNWKCGIIIKDTSNNSKQYLPIEQMSDVRAVPFTDEGDNTYVTDSEIPKLLCIAFYKGTRDLVNVHYLTLIASEAATAQIWRVGLHRLISSNTWNHPRIITIEKRQRWLYAACLATEDNNRINTSDLAGLISKDAFNPILEKLTTSINIHSNKTISASDLTFELFLEILDAVYLREDLKIAFESIVGSGDSWDDIDLDMTLTTEQLVSLLSEDQRDPRLNEILSPLPTKEDCRVIINTYESQTANRAHGRISLRSLNKFLMNDAVYGSASDPMHSEQYQDMTQPLAHYYINSSHNTYLTGSQWQSKSTVEIYRQCLLAGCRCIEIDIWDGQDGEPEVTHGHTMCTRISFQAVMQAVADFAFVNSPWPIILSFENHCSPSQMRKIAAYCKSIFGDLLQSTFLDGDGYDTIPNNLPSPEMLKHKIIIKNKKRKARTDEAVADLCPNQSEAAKSYNQQLIIDGEVVEDDEEELRRIRERSGEIVKELSDLVNYCTPKKAIRLVAGKPEVSRLPSTHEFLDYNKMQLSRIYPHGTRINSTNFNPQTDDMPLQLNFGKFEDNGRSGYILKPLLYTDPSKTYNPFNRLPIDDVVPLNVSVKIISLYGINKKTSTPYVEVQFYGIPADSKKHQYKTRQCRGRGLCPRWRSDNQFKVTRLVLPNLVIVRFAVFDGRDEKCLGWSTIPLTSLRPGFRYIYLRNSQSPLTAIFVHIKIDIFMMSEHADFADVLTNPLETYKPSERNLIEMSELLEDDETQEEKEAEVSEGNDHFGNLLSLTKAADSAAARESLRNSLSLGLSQSSMAATFINTESSSRVTVHALAGLYERELQEYIRNIHKPLEEKVIQFTNQKKIIQLKANFDKALSKRELEKSKKISTLEKNTIGKIRKLHKLLSKQLSEIKRSKSKQDSTKANELLNHLLQEGCRQLLDLELAFIQALYDLHVEYIQSHTYALSVKHHNAVADAMTRALTQCHADEKKAFDKTLHTKWIQSDSTLRKGNMDLREEHEKKMERAAIQQTQVLKNLIQDDMEKLEKKLQDNRARVEDEYQRELEGAKSRFERAATKIHALQESKYHSPTTTIRWGEVSADSYIQLLQETGRLSCSLFHEEN
eukprot:gene2092-5146_t